MLCPIPTQPPPHCVMFSADLAATLCSVRLSEPSQAPSPLGSVPAYLPTQSPVLTSVPAYDTFGTDRNFHGTLQLYSVLVRYRSPVSVSVYACNTRCPGTVVPGPVIAGPTFLAVHPVLLSSLNRCHGLCVEIFGAFTWCLVSACRDESVGVSGGVRMPPIMPDHTASA
eukprot:3018410-Rhodomonas_salina.1